MLGFNTEFLVISLVLGCLGGVLKHRFDKLPNGMIPTILFVLSVSACATWGFYLSDATGRARVMEAVLLYGLPQGFIAAAISAEVWDVFHGLWKVYLKDLVLKIAHVLRRYQGGLE